MTDHLVRLCLDGAGSVGQYTPHSFSLRLHGVDQPVDHVVYLHEVHHAALNDVTAWGTALHVFARLPGEAGCEFRPLLDACRTTHESLATFASVQIASARHGNLDDVLAAYPSYVPLYESAVRLTAGVAGPNRRQLVVTALARLCMQTPVLAEITVAGLAAFRLAMLRELDRPDARWYWFLRRHPGALADAAAEADRRTTAEFGRHVLDSDGPDGDLYVSTDRTHDAAWDFWEESAYEHLRAMLAAEGARTLGFNDHQDGTTALVALAERDHGPIGVRAALPADTRQSDATLASAVLQQVRHDFSGADRHIADLLPSLDEAGLPDLMSTCPVVAGQPALLIDARPARRLAQLYRWPGESLPPELRDETQPPVVAVRTITDDGQGDSVITHSILRESAELTTLQKYWQARGHLVSCVSTSCLADRQWAKQWIPSLRNLGPLFILVDVEPDRFVPGWASAKTHVTVVGIDIEDTAGRRTALAMAPGDSAVWWLVIADDVTTRLMGEYLRGQLGDLLHTDPEQFTPVRAVATVAITHLLATESFASFDALGNTHAS
jgi:hypothetical protein